MAMTAEPQKIALADAQQIALFAKDFVAESWRRELDNMFRQHVRLSPKYEANDTQRSSIVFKMFKFKCMFSTLLVNLL